MMKEFGCIRCNFCEWAGDETDLSIKKDGSEFMRVCPECETDEYLIDLLPEEVERLMNFAELSND